MLMRGVVGSLNNLGKQGHIEDIAITSGYQGKGLGTKIIEVLGSIAQQVGCYKVCPLSSLFFWLG
jgi:GNAT superfamily N-acetyltransferase